jgi:WXG100 family type VII secretion target
MSMIKVTSEELRSTSADLQRGGEDVAQQLQSLEGKVRSLVDAEWSGAASDAFRDLWTQWHQGASNVKEALDGISGMLARAAQAYQDTEDELANKLRG